jgi:predicted dehydrogenase
MGAWHARYANTCGAFVSGIVDRDQEAARRLASRFAGNRIFSGLDQLLNAGKPDVLHVCTPLDSHFEIIETALESGIHVLAEKPLTADLAGTRQLLSLAGRKSLLLAPVHQFLFQNGFERVQAELPRLGPVLHIDATFCSAGGDNKKAASLDEIASEILPHPLALSERLLPGILNEMEWSGRRTREGEWRVLGNAWGDARGVSLSLLISLRGRPTEATFRIVTEGGVAELDLFHGFATIDVSRVSRTSKIVRPFRRSTRHFWAATGNLAHRAVTREAAYPGLRNLIAKFYAAVGGHSAAPITPDEVLAVAGARDHLLRLEAFVQRRSAP